MNINIYSNIFINIEKSNSFFEVLILNTKGNSIYVYRWIKIVDEKFSIKSKNELINILIYWKFEKIIAFNK